MTFIAWLGQPPRVTSGRSARRAAEAFVPTTTVGVLGPIGLNLPGDGCVPHPLSGAMGQQREPAGRRAAPRV